MSRQTVSMDCKCCWTTTNGAAQSRCKSWSMPRKTQMTIPSPRVWFRCGCGLQARVLRSCCWWQGLVCGTSAIWGRVVSSMRFTR